eukprot:TRINITY_DN3194_c0_g1_i3.p1 TRINITY_DN3194_c0_g1~~TRINITY_DN3194_c0_g1_i3.p1  ORF type:complete len:619 (+),score=242.09 TRINITY_DN3194_c0_g1_i3:29-1858(+)
MVHQSVHGRVRHHYAESTHSMFQLKDEKKGIREPSMNFLSSRTRSFFYRDYSGEDNDRWTYHLPEHPTILQRLLAPVRSFLAWMRLLCDNFDWRFIFMVVCGQHLLKGMLAGGGSEGLLVVEGMIYMRLHVGASLKTVYQAIGGSAWGLKPLYALISDVFSIGGYRRTPWIIFTALLASVAYFFLVVESAHLTGAMVCMCFFLAKLQLSWTDLMIEATYTEKMEDCPKYSADIVSFAWSGIGLFGMVGIFIAGPGVDLLGPVKLLGLAIPFSMFIIIPAMSGFLTEKRLPKKDRGLRIEHLKKEWHYFLCTFILILGVLATIAAGVVFTDAPSQAAVALLVCTVTTTSAIVLLPPVVWKPLVYMFLTSALSLATGGFVDNFYLDAATKEDSLRTGFPVCETCPHFHATFYYTVMGVCDSLFMMVGSYIFSTYMSHWSYRRALCISTILSSCTSFLDIMQYQRWNLLVGIPDWAFMLGKNSIQNTVAMINFMPSTILVSKVCPEGMEASVYALLAGFSNFGGIVSGYMGAYVLTLLGMGAIGEGEVDDFSQAWKACVIGAVSSMVALLLMPLLIPNKAMTDDLLKPEEACPSEEVRLVTNGSNLFSEEEY